MRRSPKQNRSQKKLQQILNAARKVLIQRGYEGFTTNHVANEANCNIGTVYRYFPEKNEIIKSLYLSWLAEEKAVNQKAVQELVTPIDPAELVGELFLRHLCEHDQDAHVLAIELTKALYLNAEVRELDIHYENDLVDTVSTHQHLYIEHKFSKSQISYALKLAVSLLVMINLASAKERDAMSEMAVATLKSTIRSWY